MSSSTKNIYKKLDWTLIICYLVLVIFGWFNIYASVYDEGVSNMFSLSQRSGIQLLWIGIAFITAILLLFVISPKLYVGLSWWLYIFVIILLTAVLIFGREVNGSKSWLMLGSVGFQPSEFSKITTSLALAVLMGKYGFKISYLSDLAKAVATILLPVLLIILEPDVGTVLVYCGFVFVLYREGLSGWIILYAFLAIILFIITLKFSSFAAILVLIGILGIIRGILSKKLIRNILIYGLAIVILSFIPKLLQWDFIERFNKLSGEYWLLIISVPIIINLIINGKKTKQSFYKYLIISYICSIILIFSVDFIFDNVLKDHHRDRIENLLGIKEDLQGAGYNVNQSKIAIGSGGFAGKGYLQGTQTKFNFVPEQSTDFIFCTVGEEWGFIGSLGVLSIFLVMILRIIDVAEKQKNTITRIYGYCIASCLFMHVFINVGMTIGLMPVVGIPLPFISYGGTSFLSFTIMLFIFIRLDLERWK